MSSQESFLFSEFTPTTLEAWVEKATQDLKGKPFNRLEWRTGEGFSLKPFYHPSEFEAASPLSPGEWPMRRGNQFNQQEGGWQITQEVNTDHSEVSQTVLTAREAGLSAFWFKGEEEKSLARTLEQLGKQLPLHQTALHLHYQQAPSLLAADIYMQLAQQKIAPELLTGTSLNDPIGHALAMDEAASLLSLANVEAGIQAFSASPWFRSTGIDLSYAYHKGASLSLQLALALAKVVEYASFVEQSESDLRQEDLFRSLAFTFPIGSSFFLEIAKLRAFRVLFCQLLEAYGIDDPELASPFLTGRVSEWHYTRYDEHNNLLRATTSAMAAVIGVVQALVLPPFDSLKGEENATSARLARNIQHLLIHESYLDRVKDPAGGSYYVEQATDALAQQAWGLFQEIEQVGGLRAAIEQGLIAQWMEENRAHQDQAMAKRRRTQVGINQFANPDEQIEEWSAEKEVPRQAQAFEQIRHRLATQSQETPLVYLLLFGDTRMRNARSQFARNLFTAAGLRIQETSHQTDLSAALAEVQQVKPALLVFCAGDTDYADQLLELTPRLKDELPGTRFILAGKPENWADYEVEAPIFAGMDALEFLGGLVESLIAD